MNLKHAEDGVLYDQPNKYARAPGVELGPATLVHGYQEFRLTADSVEPLPQDPPLLRKRQLMSPVFDADFLAGKTLLDLGANGGFFSFWARQRGARNVVALDMDQNYIRQMEAVQAHFGVTGFRTASCRVQDWEEPADVVLAFALVHWLFSCTAAYGSLDAVAGKLRSLTQELLVIEWVAPEDTAIISFKHTDWNRSAVREAYNLAAFEAALRRHFARIEIVGQTCGTRMLYFAWCRPREITLDVNLPLLAPVGRLFSSRCLVEVEGKKYSSRVYLGEDNQTIWKQATDDLAWRDGELLRRLNGPHFPRVLETRKEAGWSVAILERVTGVELRQAIPQIASTPAALAAFFSEGLDILEALQAAEMTHRDIQIHNLLIRDGHPVLIDFGWAVAPDMPCFEPRGLGDEGRPADGSFCDVYGMGKVFATCAPVNHALFSPLISAMTAADRSRRITGVAALRQILDALVLPAAWAAAPVFASIRHHLDPNPWRNYVPAILGRVTSLLLARNTASARSLLEATLLFRPDSPELRSCLSEIIRAQANQKVTGAVSAPVASERRRDSAAGSPRPEPSAAVAVEKLQSDVQLEPSNAALRLKLGTTLLQQGDVPGALAEFTEVCRLEPENADVGKATASLLIQLNRLPEAALALNQVIQRHPADVEALGAQAACFLNVGELAAARATYQRILELEPGNAGAEAGLGMVATLEKQEARPRSAGGQPAKSIPPKGGHDEDSRLFTRPVAAPAAPGDGETGSVHVSVVIPVFNKSEFTKKCLAQLAAVSSSISHEVIVVDNGSTDDTESFCLGWQETHANVRYCRLEQNYGFGRACNHGAGQAHGQWVVFLNNDTEPLPGWLEAAVARLQSDPAIGVVGAKLLYPDRTVQHCGIEFFFNPNLAQAVWPSHRHLRAPENDPAVNAAGEVAAVTGACLFISASLFESVGGFSPEYPMYFEDTDLCFKVREAGRKVFYEPKCVVIHYESQSSASRERVDALNRESAGIFYRKWPAQVDKFVLEASIEKIEGRFTYFRQSVLPLTPSVPPNLACALARLFHHVGPFYVHFGGAGDALLLLATFLDQHPDAQVISFPNSIPAMRSFFEAFPSLKRVWFLPKNESPHVHMLLRLMMRHCPNFRGMGITPEDSYPKTWHAGLDIFKEMNVSRRPEWIRQFRTHPRPNQVVLAPKGGLRGMVGSKRNIIHPSVWPQLIRLVLESGFQPVIIGTPEEKKDYPALKGCEDRRSYCYPEQMELIANSAVVIGADSWAKTFGGLAGIPTIVFEPVKGPDLDGWKDYAEYVFIDPWETITLVKNLEQCRDVLKRIPVAPAAKALTEVPAASRPQIVWEGSFVDYGSMSHTNREMSSHLAGTLDVTRVGPNQLKGHAQADPELQHCAAQIVPHAPAGTVVTVRHQWPPNWSRPASGALVLFQPWEFGALPEAWVKAAGNVDEFWVPSPAVRAMYLDSGIAPEKVQVVPNGVDSKKFRPGLPPFPLPTNKKFKFLFVGGTIFRKGPDVLLEAFARTFSAAADVCLVIKDFGGDSFYRGQTAEAAVRALQQNPAAPEIIYLNSELSSEQVPSLYAACDCFVLPYRGEGFGMPVLEAMACGLPVIVTAGGATDSFVSPEAGWKITSQIHHLKNQVGDIKLVANGWLLEPSKAHLGELMRYAAGHREECRQRGAAGRAIVEKSFDWNEVASVAALRLRELAARAPVNRSAAPVSAGPAISARAAAPAKPPAVALVGRLEEARQLLGRNEFEEAWRAATTAIAHRPFHPEGFLLLAEIALAAGDGKAARRCAQRARDLAPGWPAPKQFLAKALKGNSKPDWLVLPESKNNRLSVCLIVKNEERFLAQCLKSVRGFATQIIVVDTGSTDRTVEIAREFGAEIYSFAWCDDFAAARNAALEHATGDWVLMLDADEELPPAQHAKLAADMKAAGVVACRLPLVNAGRELEGCSCVPRLFRNLPGAFFKGRIHEQVFASLLARAGKWGLKSGVGTAELLHHGYSKDVVRDRNKIERNLKLLRAAVEEDPADVNLRMNLGLELVRSDDLAAGLVHYREAYELMSRQRPESRAPELREVLLMQFSSQLYAVGDHAEVVRVLTSPVATNGGLTASLHFSLGLAHYELKQFREAADQMRQCLSKRNQRCLTPINTDILAAAPHHCLALCLVALGDPRGAEKAFQAAVAGPNRADVARLDYATFLRKDNRPVEALQQLNAIVAADSGNAKAWRLGGEIALGRPDFLEFALDWTAEALKALPDSPVTAAQRAEALMLNSRPAEALPFWEKIWSSEHDPRVLAALILCEIAASQPAHAPGAAPDERAASLAFVEWYQKLIASRAHTLIQKLNAGLAPLSRSLPTAAEMLRNALSEADLPLKA